MNLKQISKDNNNSIIISLFKNKIQNINIEIFKRILDENISFSEYFGEKMPSQITVKMTIGLFNVDSSIINFNTILKCFREGNPQAYQLLLNHPNGTNWLRQTLEELKERYG